MYAMGIPAGLLVDKKGPRWGVAVGAVALACGYFPIQSGADHGDQRQCQNTRRLTSPKAYQQGPGSMSLNFLSFCSFLTGLGSCTSFSAAIKTCETPPKRLNQTVLTRRKATFNWPDHRGTATAFPLSGFGLSAFFFATIASFAFGDNIADFLLLLSIGTLCLNIGALPFMSLIPTTPEYSAVPSEEIRRPRSRTDPVKFERTRSASSANTLHHGKQCPKSFVSSESQHPQGDDLDLPGPQSSADESSTLVSAAASDVEDGRRNTSRQPRHHQKGSSPSRLEITGFKILQRLEFWQLFSVLALLAGVGLMTIK